MVITFASAAIVVGSSRHRFAMAASCGPATGYQDGACPLLRGIVPTALLAIERSGVSVESVAGTSVARPMPTTVYFRHEVELAPKFSGSAGTTRHKRAQLPAVIALARLLLEERSPGDWRNAKREVSRHAAPLTLPRGRRPASFRFARCRAHPCAARASSR